MEKIFPVGAVNSGFSTGGKDFSRGSNSGEILFYQL